MDTMIRTFFRHVLESFKSLKRNFLMTLASAFTVTVTLFLVGCFLSAIMNLREIASEIENNVTVSVYVEVGTEKKERNILKNQLKKIKHVKKVDFSGKDAQLQEMKDALGKTWDLFQGDSNPLCDVFILNTDSPSHTKQVADAAKKLKHVDDSQYGGEKTDMLIYIMEKIQFFGSIVAGLILILAIFLITNTVRMTILSRQKDIQIMRLVGAENGFIRWPFFLEGAWIGLIGSIVPITLIFFLYRLAYCRVNPGLIRGHYYMIRPVILLPQITVLLVLTGVLIGAFGSILAMRRFLKL